VVRSLRRSLRDVRDLLVERGVDVSPSTILAWVHTFGPLLAAEIRQARPLGGWW
jgi:transposase-like protein